ncbi:MAG: MBL fold metallo-hydrolase [Candidatus Thermoplasmatota archaeon]|nr:MBL fold metallo-hydrolase [Candidatus Thermoplasmatota archaeon]
MTKLTFLGTGGGRLVTLTQERSTGGIYLEDARRIHIDPGPGSLSALKRNHIDPTWTDAIMISHCHPDHYTDAEILIEGMSVGRRGRRGTLIAPLSVIRGKGSIGPAISRYHKEKLRSVRTLGPGNTLRVGPLEITGTPSTHGDPTGIGFKITTSNGTISYVSDTELSDAVIQPHIGSRILILPVTRPLRSRIPGHLSTEDASFFAEKVRPEICLLNHLGRRMLRSDPEMQARWIEEHSGVRTIAAKDDMALRFDHEGIVFL